MQPALGAEGHGPRQGIGRAERTPASGPMIGPTTVDLAPGLILMERPPREGETTWLPSVPLVFPFGSVGNGVRLSPMFPV